MIKLSTIKKEQPQSKTIFLDLNCDLGEGFGIYNNSREQDLLPYV
ncbi:MAG: LamB/YcsF family protein, partial [Vampirovibrionia bacterium]